MSRTPSSGEDIIVVSGLPRSGTSLMMQLLEAGGVPVLTDRSRAPDEHNPRGYYEFEPVKRTGEDPSWLDRAGGRAVKMVYRLVYDLPARHRYRLILMRRRLEEVLASQRAMLEGEGKPDDLPDARMAGIFRRELEAFERWAGGQPNVTLLGVDYNRLLAEPEPLLRSVASFLGGGLDETAMARAIDPSLYRNRRGG